MVAGVRRALLLVAAASFGASFLGAIRPTFAREDEVDGRMPVRVGWGSAAAYPAPSLSIAVESELSGRLSDHVSLFVGSGFEGVIVYDPRAPDIARGFTAVGIGGGVFIRTKTVGPAVAFSMPISLDLRGDSVAGAGIGFRATFYPYYHSLVETLACPHGPLGSYVGSSIFFWTGVRLDTLDESKGATVSFGAGIDLSRSVLVPLIGWIFRQGCSKERAGESYVK